MNLTQARKEIRKLKKQEYDFVLPPEEWVINPVITEEVQQQWADQKLGASQWTKKHLSKIKGSQPLILVIADTAAKWNFEDINYCVLEHECVDVTGTGVEDDHGHSHMIGSTTVSKKHGVWTDLAETDRLKIVLIKCMSKGAGQWVWVLDMAKTVTSLADKYKGHQIVVNCSFGARGATNSAISNEIEKGIRKGNVTYIGSMGNSGNSDPNRDMGGFPAIDENVIGVGAVDQNMKVKSYSSRSKSIELTSFSGLIGYNHRGEVGRFEGTSFSGPIQAMTTSLIYLARLATPDNFRNAIKTRTIDLGKEGWDDLYGHGLITQTSWEAIKDKPTDPEPPKEEPEKPEEPVKPEPPKDEPVKKQYDFKDVRIVEGQQGEMKIIWKRSSESSDQYKTLVIKEVHVDYKTLAESEEQALSDLLVFIKSFAKNRGLGMPDHMGMERAIYYSGLFMKYFKSKPLPGILKVNKIIAEQNGIQMEVDMEHIRTEAANDVNSVYIEKIK